VPKKEKELTPEMKRELEEMLIEELEFELRKIGFTDEQLAAARAKACARPPEPRRH